MKIVKDAWLEVIFEKVYSEILKIQKSYVKQKARYKIISFHLLLKTLVSNCLMQSFHFQTTNLHSWTSRAKCCQISYQKKYSVLDIGNCFPDLHKHLRWHIKTNLILLRALSKSYEEKGSPTVSKLRLLCLEYSGN